MAGTKSDAWALDVLKLLFNATAVSLVADNAGTTPLTNLYVSLHTALSQTSSAQTTTEAAYTSYTRVAVARTSGGWTVSGTTLASVSPVANISFPAGTGAGETCSHFGVGSVVSAPGRLFYWGTIAVSIITGNTITPILTTATTITED